MTHPVGHGLILAAPTSGSGKTTITLGLLRALSRRGVQVRGAKSGPDYIDPRFHEAACGEPCFNLDAWAMPPAQLASLAAGVGLLLIEGAMGLFDGAPPDGKGATADLAHHLGLPVVLIVDAGHMAQSVAPLVSGFANFSSQTKVCGIILNRVGSDRHERMLRKALEPLGLPVLGALHRQGDLAHPSRHLGLVQASERDDLQAYLDRAGGAVEEALDLDLLLQLAGPIEAPARGLKNTPPPAQNIAVASDQAFAFAYPHQLKSWRDQGAGISFFSPLADQAPPEADLIILPGGYPELYAGRLASNNQFLDGMNKASQTSDIYGECGGYMALGRGLVDAEGTHHKMIGLLDLETSFAKRKLSLGYRRLSAQSGPFRGTHMGHEFHYATTLRAEGPAVFQAEDAEGAELPPMGLRKGRVSGSFAHIIQTVLPLR